MKYGWDHPATVERYEQFCARHPRYREANEQLVEHAAIEAGQSVLDIAAGTGRTAEAAVAAGARVVCYEPATAMRALGMSRLPRAEWVDSWPDRRFDRVLCGAALWQLLPFGDSFRRVSGLLRDGGVFVFNIPGLYLGIPDEPGGGSDPLLLEFAARLAEAPAPNTQPDTAQNAAPNTAPNTTAAEPLPDPPGIEALLSAAGLECESWRFRIRITQAVLRDWMRIPVLTDTLLGDLDLEARDRRIEQAWRNVDQESWKWETWIGWKASKR